MAKWRARRGSARTVCCGVCDSSAGSAQSPADWQYTRPTDNKTLQDEQGVADEKRSERRSPWRADRLFFSMRRPDLPDFKSAPWCFNGHVHTILPALIFRCPHLGYQRIRIPTPDHDFLDIDLVENQAADAPVAILFHGLEGSARSYYIQRLARKLFDEGMHVIAVNFRSCSDELNHQPRFYHSGETRDPQTIFEWARRAFPSSACFAAGFSLGASSLLNYVRHAGTTQGLTAFSAISTPYDLRNV